MSDGFDLLAHAAGDSDPDLALEAQAHAVFLALPDTGVHNAFPRIIEFDVLKVLETPIEDFEAVLCTGRITAGAHHGADDTSPIAQGGTHQPIARRFSMAGL